MLAVALLLLVALLGRTRSAAAEDEPIPSAADAADDQGDPIEPVNRFTFEFNRRVLWYTARPIAKGYRTIVPRPLRDGFRNALDNLNAPLQIGNDLLQGDPGAASRTFARFLVNSTAGVGGTIDVAWRLGIPNRDSDLGMTLGSWGVGEGPYVVLPFLGPSTPRDAIGSFAQGSADPFNLWVQKTDYAFYALLVRFVLGNIDLYSRRMDQLDRIEESSVDFYASLRSLYRGKRRSDIRKIGAGELAAPSGIDYDLDLDADAGEDSAPEESAEPAPAP